MLLTAMQRLCRAPSCKLKSYTCRTASTDVEPGCPSAATSDSCCCSLVVLQSPHSDLEAVLGEIASGRNLPQPLDSEKAAAAAEMMTYDDADSPPSPGGSSGLSRPGPMLTTDDLAAFDNEEPGVAAALAMLKFHNPGLPLMRGTQAAAAAASSDGSGTHTPAAVFCSSNSSPTAAGSSRNSVDLAWGEQLADPTVTAASRSRDALAVQQAATEQQTMAPVTSVQQAALAARLRAAGVGHAFAAAGFPAHSSSSTAEAEAQQRLEGQQEGRPAQQPEALTLNDAIAATALLASVFKLGEQQQRLVIGGLLGTGLFSAPALEEKVDQQSCSRAEQEQHLAKPPHCSSLAAQQQGEGSIDISVDRIMKAQATTADAAADLPAAAVPAVTGCLQYSMQAPAQQLQCQVSRPAGSAATGTACVTADKVIQRQGQQDHSAAGPEPMPATAMAFLAALLARQGAAA